MEMNIFLIGFRCSGKTSVGRELALRTGKTFIDSDREFVENYGGSIAETVEDRGWQYFRRLETQIIKQICRGKNQIVATGGGVVLDTANIAAMKKSGTLVWLQAGAETIRERMAEDRNTKGQRPALTSKGILEEIVLTLGNRKQYYAGAADLSVNTDSRSINEICDIIMGRLARYGTGR